MYEQVKELMTIFGGHPNETPLITLMPELASILDEEGAKINDEPVKKLEALVNLLYAAYGAYIALDLLHDEVECTQSIEQSIKDFMFAPSLLEAEMALDNLVAGVLASEYDIEGAFAEVYRSKMSKLDSTGKPIKNYDGKILNGPEYIPPRLEPFLVQKNLS